MPQGYDPKCRELAEYFLARPQEFLIEPRVAELAQAIQDAVENTLNGFDAELENAARATEDDSFLCEMRDGDR